MGEGRRAETGGRLHCVVRGRVQGVGFRAFVVDRGRALGVVGWVRNLPDGRSVEVVAEGPAERLERLRDALREGPPGAYVERCSCEWQEPTGEFTAFGIRR
ncbi:MAG: acylphosphatase [Thermomicrobiaceae bacterium]|nr:acylphosphatase [Thermomicrobiaceae bacterium]